MLVGNNEGNAPFIKTITHAPVHHAAYLERDSSGKLWAIDVADRHGNDLQPTPFEDWVRQYDVVIAARLNSLGTGQNPIQFLKTSPKYGYNPATNTFTKGPKYNTWGAVLGGIDGVGDLTRNKPDQKFCSEFVCDTQLEVTGKPLPGLPQNSWRTPGDMLRALPEWGVDLRELVFFREDDRRR